MNSTFGIIGLGVMGKSISRNIAGKGFSLAVYNRAEDSEKDVVKNFLADYGRDTIQGFVNLPEFINALEKPRKILMMIKAGPIVDRVIENLVPDLSAGDIIIDGGNSHYLDTQRRHNYLLEKNIFFIGAGISGGEEGALKGPSIMPGGEKEAYEKIAPILTAIAAKDMNGDPCCTYIGPGGSGHFIKMTHNGIEYVEMQLLAELYALMNAFMSYEEIAQTFIEWGKGELSSYLLEITAKIFREKEGDEYLLNLILDKAGNKGTGSWSSQAALDLGIPNTMMSAAVFARYISSFKAARVKLAGSRMIKEIGDKGIDLDMLKRAYNFARIINHQQGFNLIKHASDAHKWDLNLSEVARIWTNGCIIRSTLMADLSEVFKASADLFEQNKILNTLEQQETDAAKLLQHGLKTRTPLSAFSAAYNYWAAMTTAQLPANLIQAQRDFFGAHTYQRVNDASMNFYHSEWLS